jgi:signal transduction histidine kinase
MTNAKEIGINYKEYQKYLRIFSFPIYDNMQNIRNVAIIFEDITEKKYMQNALKISEMQLSNFIEQSPNGNAILDSLGQILTQNQCMLNLFGEELAANQGDNYTEFIRKNIHRFSDTRFADKLQSFLLDTNATSLQVDTILDRDPQPAIDIVLSFFKIEVSQQFMIGCIAQDFTMRNNAEREIKRNLQRERELSEIKTAFVSMASHQFKTPMSTILSSVDLLANYISQVPDPLNTKMTKHTQRISGQILKLNEMINDFLMLGRIESGKIGKENGYFNLKIFLEQLIQEHFSTTENQPKLVFQTIEQSVFSDEKNLRHIFLNLISNAYKYSNGQAPEIRIHIANNLTVEVADKGIGIPQNEQQHIFGTFYRATNAETYKGTGLGLAIVKRLVETHLGTISFESSEGHGTTFHFEIPLSQS